MVTKIDRMKYKCCPNIHQRNLIQIYKIIADKTEPNESKIQKTPIESVEDVKSDVVDIVNEIQTGAEDSKVDGDTKLLDEANIDNVEIDENSVTDAASQHAPDADPVEQIEAKPTDCRNEAGVADELQTNIIKCEEQSEDASADNAVISELSETVVDDEIELMVESTENANPDDETDEKSDDKINDVECPMDVLEAESRVERYSTIIPVDDDAADIIIGKLIIQGYS